MKVVIFKYSLSLIKEAHQKQPSKLEIDLLLRLQRNEASDSQNASIHLSGFQMTVDKTKTKAITPTNHNRNEQHYEPITVPSNYPQLAQSAGKITRTWCDWFWLYFSLVEKLA